MSLASLGEKRQRILERLFMVAGDTSSAAMLLLSVCCPICRQRLGIAVTPGMLTTFLCYCQTQHAQCGPWGIDEAVGQHRRPERPRTSREPAHRQTQHCGGCNGNGLEQ